MTKRLKKYTLQDLEILRQEIGHQKHVIETSEKIFLRDIFKIPLIRNLVLLQIIVEDEIKIRNKKGEENEAT